MKERQLKTTNFVALPLEEVFDFFSRAENLERITPPEMSFNIQSDLPIVMGVGTEIDYKLRASGIPMEWRSRITEWDPPHAFVDEQLKGPYALWIHRHSFHPVKGGTVVADFVRYALPFWPLGELAHPLVKAQLDSIFAYRRRAVKELLGTTRTINVIGTSMTPSGH